MLRIMFKGVNTLEQKGEILLKDVEWTKFITSRDGALLAILTPEIDALNEVHHEIKVYRCEGDDPMEFLDKIENK